MDCEPKGYARVSLTPQNLRLFKGVPNPMGDGALVRRKRARCEEVKAEWRKRKRGKA